MSQSAVRTWFMSAPFHKAKEKISIESRASRRGTLRLQLFSNRLKFTPLLAHIQKRRITPCDMAPRSAIPSRLSLQRYFVEAITELLGQIQRLLIRTGECVHRIEPSRQPAELAELTEYLAV